MSQIQRTYAKELKVIGNSLEYFIDNLDGFHDRVYHQVQPHSKTRSCCLPKFRCERRSNNLLVIHAHPGGFVSRNFFLGFMEALGNLSVYDALVFSLDTPDNCSDFTHFPFAIKAEHEPREANGEVENAVELENKISNTVFCNAFPFHVIFDRKLRIVQVGAGLQRFFGSASNLHGKDFRHYFRVIHPTIHATFTSFLTSVNSPMELAYRAQSRKWHCDTTVYIVIIN